MKKIILNGASYPIPVSKDNVSSRSQQSDLIGAIKLENNKSESKTQEDKDFIIKNYRKEVSKGWMIPFYVRMLQKSQMLVLS